MLKAHHHSFRIRYSETDQMGVVYHGNYAQFFELGRTEWLRSLGITYKSIEKNGIMLPVINLSFQFIKPALYDEVITVKTTLLKKPGVKIEFSHVINNKKGELLTTGNSILAFINVNTRKPIRCPNEILNKLDF